jgi:hypothetical protein
MSGALKMAEPKIENSTQDEGVVVNQNKAQAPDKPVSWLPENKVSLMSFLFLFFVGFYGIFMVSISWILYWVFALCFSPKITNGVLAFFSKKHTQ